MAQSVKRLLSKCEDPRSDLHTHIKTMEEEWVGRGRAVKDGRGVGGRREELDYLACNHEIVKGDQ